MKKEIFAGIFDLPETLDRGPPHYGSGLFVFLIPGSGDWSRDVLRGSLKPIEKDVP